MYFIYSLLMGLAALLLTPYWLVQGLRHGKYFSNLGQRLGFSFPTLSKLPKKHAGAIWIHAVSVGEALSGVTLARRLKQAYPDISTRKSFSVDFDDAAVSGGHE